MPAALSSVPELRGLTPYANLLRLMNDPVEFCRRCAATGDMVRVRMPEGGPLVALHTPELIEQVLVSKNRSFIKDATTRALGDVIGRGILVSDGEFWRRQRRMSQPAFNRERLLRHAPGMVEAARRVTAGWREGQEIDVHAAMMDLAREVVATTLLSSEVGRAAQDLGESLEALMDRYSDWRYMLAPGLARLPLPANRRFAAAHTRLFAIVDGIIAERRRSGEDRGDLLSMLLQARDEDGTAMSDAQLRDEVLILFLAGHETTALVLSWAFVLLSRRPGAWQRLGEEVDAVLAGRPVEAGDITRLPYTEAVVLETMRLRPPAWSIGREAIEDVEVGGILLPRTTQVWIFQWSSHRDPRSFARPLAFEPERWLDGLLHRLPRGAYFPFGGGPRLCIGNNFAMLEAVLLLATIAQRWRPQVAERDVPRPQFSITLRPRGGVRATLRGRRGGRISGEA